MFLNIILLFLSGFIVDIVWAFYVRAISENKKMLSSTYSVCIGICSLLFLNITIEHMMLSPIWLIGLFFGTYFSKDIEQFIIKNFNKNKNI